MKSNLTQAQPQGNDSPFEVKEDNRGFFAKLMEKRRVNKVIREGRKDTERIMAEYRAEKAKPITLVNPDSAQQKVKKHLEDGKSITVVECLRLYHSTELRGIIARLRKSMTIHDTWVEQDGRRFKRYYI